MKIANQSSPDQSRHRRILVLAAVSGLVGVAHEVVWVRVLGLWAGHGVSAASLVVATFMGGLALGSALVDRVRARITRPLLAYGMLEALVALHALVLLPLVQAADGLAQTGWELGGASLGSLLAYLAWAAVLLGLPTMAMGATIPLLLDALGHGSPAVLRRLYAANSLGGAAGALAVTFLALPLLGTRNTLWALAALGALVTASAALTGDLSRLDAALPTERLRKVHGPTPVKRGAAGPNRPQAAILVAALTGMVGMLLQMAWTRTLVTVLGSSTYAFSVILSVFILGLAAGSVFLGHVRPARLLGILGLAALGSHALLGHSWRAAHVLFGSTTESFWGLCAAGIVLVSVVTFPATLALGGLLPATLEMAGDPGRTGRLYAFNTAGALVGTLGATLLTIPYLGLAGTLSLAGAVALSLAAGLAVRRRAPLGACAGLAVAAFGHWAVGSWDPGLMSSGPFVTAPSFAQAAGDAEELLRHVERAGKILFHREGPMATVAVRQTPEGLRTLVVNGKPDASTLLDMKTQRLVGHLPLILHPAPRTALLIGLGSGVTAGAMLTHPVEELTVVELCPEVVDASRLFEGVSGAPLDDPRLTLEIGDGRTHVRRSHATYDVITSEPTNPWIAGVASLFTREFFQAARSRLNPGGIMAQWVQSYSFSAEDFASVVATYRSVFPHVSLWQSVKGADYILVGSESPLDLDPARLGRAFGAGKVGVDLADVDVRDVEDVLAHRHAGATGVEALTRRASLQTDDQLALEFSAPRRLFQAIDPDLARRLDAIAIPDPSPASPVKSEAVLWARRSRYRAYDHLREGNLRNAVDVLVAVETTCRERHISTAFLEGFYVSVATHMQAAGQVEPARLLLEGQVERFPRHPGYMAALACADARCGRIPEARGLYRELVDSDSNSEAGHRGLAVLAEAAGDLSAASRHWETLGRLRPRDPLPVLALARVRHSQSKPHEALKLIQLARRLDPGVSLTGTGVRDGERGLVLR